MPHTYVSDFQLPCSTHGDFGKMNNFGTNSDAPTTADAMRTLGVNHDKKMRSINFRYGNTNQGDLYPCKMRVLVDWACIIFGIVPSRGHVLPPKRPARI